MAKQRMMLYFGSFNPIHRGHIALAEYAVEHNLCDVVAMIISPQNPFKQNWTLAQEMDRYSMVEIACSESRFPERIQPSVIEFLLEKPSYTINTLRHLKENYGEQMEFSILMGTDLINQLPQWREAERIIEDYDIYVYPRPGVEMTYKTARTTFLADAPQCDFSSTDVRRRLESGEDVSRMLDREVIKYIRERGLWSIEGKIERLSRQIEEQAEATLYLERGKCYYRRNEWGKAINDFRQAEQLDKECIEAVQFRKMTEEILEYRYKDIYNP
mgnify:CR=1 FL=1